MIPALSSSRADGQVCRVHFRIAIDYALTSVTSLNRVLIRLESLVTIFSVAAAGIPAIYQHIKMRDAEARAEASRELANDDTAALDVVEANVSILDSALTEAVRREYTRDLLLQFVIGVPL